MKLRLPDDAKLALREAAARSGLSQQHMVREAIDEKLGVSRSVTRGSDVADAADHARNDRLVALGITVARSPFRELDELIPVGSRQTSAALLDRADRVE